ncbi:GNAT family N-acetyltransferase [Lysobacter sp. A6]|uniref:GNAT family N-acetyltransferase n=1 Tax=Noviluteimonas lactosilytica TaxID=2888523 RepID=A0ABS8JM30_9GAMM|nr:GNAT family N-acetyltransferase [Lysobacter lactosilyticus]MCC8364669.1 GNAT family N-acetyltransferase [Lysobacter lactosilyticus]
MEQLTDVPRWSEVLRDRTHVVIRPLVPTDRDAERAFIEQLSAETCRYRFLGFVRHPSERLLDSLTRLDPEREVAFCAVVAEDAHDKIIGVSRFSADKDHQRCECAVVVDDEWQNKGLGTLLMRRLIEVARARGIRVMRSIDLAENIRMADLAGDLGFSRHPDPDDASQVIHELKLD